MRSWLPKLYPILDSSVIPVHGRAPFLNQLGRTFADAGVRLFEYRNKIDTDAQVLSDALVLRSALPAGDVKLILDDRIDVALAAAFDGVHVDAGDLSPSVARGLLSPGSVVGTSVSSGAQLKEALATPVDYISFGPIFPTQTKQTLVLPIGLEGVRRYRELAGPEVVLVAAAGITLQTAPSVLAAGADVVAVSAAIFRQPDPAAEFLRWMEALK